MGWGSGEGGWREGLQRGMRRLLGATDVLGLGSVLLARVPLGDAAVTLLLH